MKNAKPVIRFGILLFTIFAGLSFLLVVSHFLFSVGYVEDGKSILHIVNIHQGLFRIWRYVVYGLIILFWPNLIKAIGKKRHWQKEVIEYLSHQRIKLFVLFLIIELLFFYNLLGRFFNLFQ